VLSGQTCGRGSYTVTNASTVATDASPKPGPIADHRQGPLRRVWVIFERRERWGLSWPGRLILGGGSLAILGIVILNVHQFLALTERVNTKVLVVEGWIQGYAIRAAVEEFNRGPYECIYTTGGPENGSGGYVNDYQTAAGAAAVALHKAGIPEEAIQMAPSRVNGRDRTYSSAAALRDWLRQHQVNVAKINVLTEDCHARRTRFLYKKAFGKDVRIGIINVTNPDYDSKYWWRYSDGVREVIGESIAYVYARLFFHPRRSPDAGQQSPSNH